MKRREFLSAAAAAVTVPAIAQVVPTAPVLSLGPTTFDYYISPTGDDVLGAGTLASPWSITALNTKQSTYAGKRVGLMPGVYQYGTSNGTQTTLCSMLSAQSGGGQSCVLQVNGGSASSPTYLASCNSAGVYTARQAILDGSNPSSGAAPTGATIFLGYSGSGPSYTPANVGYITIDGLVIRNFTYAGIGFASTPFTFPGITIINCEIYNGGGVPSTNNPGGIFCWKQMPGGFISNCKIYNLRTNGGTYYPFGYAGIMFNQDTGTNEGFTATIDHCTIYNTGQCIETKNNYANVSVQYCYLEFGDPLGDYSGNGFQYGLFGVCQAPSTAVTFKYNIIIGGMFNYTTDGTKNAGAINMNNCTFYCGPANGGSVGNGMICFLDNSSTGTGSWNHCLVWSDGGYAAGNGVGGTTGGGFTADYNTYGSTCNFEPGSNFSGWQSAGYDKHGAAITASPFASTPQSATPTSFTPSAAYLKASDGNPLGALNAAGQAADGTGGVGSNF
jgi:hypothetical protein